MGSALGCAAPPVSSRAPPAPAAQSTAATATTASPTTAATGSDALHYTIAVDGDVAVFDVTVCAERALPARLRGGDPRAARAVRDARAVLDEGERALSFDEGEIVVGQGVRCARFRVDALDAALRELSPSFADRVGRDLVLNPDLFLWRGAAIPSSTGSARFLVADGVRVSTPWPRLDDGYAIGRSAYTMLGRVVVGRGFEQIEVPVPGGALDAVVLKGPLAPDVETVRTFLSLAGGAVAEAWGHFPRARAQVTLTPVPARGVPFGMVVRGGGPGVHLLVGVHGSARDLAEDWVPVHELSHLLTPALDPDDAWFGEGIATWYQNVLRVRAGLLDEGEAWRSLKDGLDRGERADDGHTLAESSRRMRREHNYTRVYWGGTAFALLADVALRTRANSSLDDALRSLSDCCLVKERHHRARELVEHMEAALGTDFLRALHDDVTSTTGFPDVDAALSSLGIDGARRGDAWDDAPEKAALRAAIMRPRAPR